MQRNELQHYCDIAKQLARQAGQAIMPYYADPSRIDAQQKTDNSPVTAADLAAHQIIVEGLQHAFPEIPILSEEAADIDYTIRKNWQQYWLIDPLDGTREFLKGSGEFTVNIALISQHVSVVGVVYSPVYGQLYWATADHHAYCEVDNEVSQLSVRIANQKKLTLAVSRSHAQKNVEKMTDKMTGHEFIHLGSSLKTCFVAAGDADLYPRLGPTSEWDTAASHCILTAAGGKIIDVAGRELRYNTQASLINPWFLAVGDLSIDWLALLPKEFNT